MARRLRWRSPSDPVRAHDASPAGYCPAAHGRLPAQNTHLGIGETGTELAPDARASQEISHAGRGPAAVAERDRNAGPPSSLSSNPASVEAQAPDVGPERGSAVMGGGRR
jgi:hypothetical protein